MTLVVGRKIRKTKAEKKTMWWKLRQDEFCAAFREQVRQALGGWEELPEDWTAEAKVIREAGRRVLGISSGRKGEKETWWWNLTVQDIIQGKKLAKKKWDTERTEERRKEYIEMRHRAKVVVAQAKQEAYDDMYGRLDTKEEEKDLYRLARQRDRDGNQVRVIKDRDGNMLTCARSVLARWKEYFEELMNEENEKEGRVEEASVVDQEVAMIRKGEVRKALKRMKNGKAVGPDDIPVEVWKTVVRPAMMYGLETVALKRQQEAELEVAEMKMLRFALGVTRLEKIRNELIRGTAKVRCFGDKIRESRLRWFGHVQRRNSEYIGRRMMRMELPGKRARGRPKRRLMDGVREDIRAVGIREEDAGDRLTWKRMTRCGDP
ncbi:uncharacterized protein LOC133466337 isoform X1 [Phyllopteryx taeniolatus]|uniref:uncharacterized protein LOC133466337 isoform X1 n=1 Tax=Phyllopteryx taeniolatus TaxID=161469 RepID=UPI002AD58F40|nr:uncharacterized protein LOC133466337 isoform X1 [Phyllopteryx taeniolatus]XP_061605920.1 uncharacterized protein LOC133466337 isoform X1 [Phyllopteryx taeniolatus]